MIESIDKFLRYLLSGAIVFVIIYALWVNYFEKELNKDEAKVFATQEEMQDRASLCLNFFNNKQFDAAFDCYKVVMEFDSSPKIKYMSAISLGNARKFHSALDLLDEVLDDETIDDDLRKKADDAYFLFSYHKGRYKKPKAKGEGDYLDELSTVAKWKHPENLKVYISDAYDKHDAILQAFLKWDAALGPKFNFTFVDDRDKADITAIAVNISELPKDKAGETIMTYKFHSKKVKDLTMDRADIKISFNNAMDEMWSDEEFKGIAVHEVGHALGIISHSSNKSDIMFHDVASYQKPILTDRDVNTVERLYNLTK